MDAQVNMAIEECAELIVELQHGRRGRDSDVPSEVADVIIMMYQMRVMFGAESVDERIAEKLDRLEGKLAGRGFTP
jgi:hypothetical protein